MGMLFDRLLSMIRAAHENRHYQPGPFVELWEKTSKRLKKEGSAAAYESWKLASIMKNLDEFKDLDDEIADSWVGVQLTRSDDGHAQYGQVAYEKLKQLQLQRETLKPKATITIDGALEIAIAFWIEARNAFNASNEDRALHGLLMCNFYLGTTYSPVTEAEAQRARGKKGNDTAARDAIVEIAVEVISRFTVSKRITLADELCSVIADQIESDPKYSDAVAAYKNWNSKSTAADTSVSDRMHNMLMALTKKKQGAQEHTEFRKAFKELHEQTKSYGLSDRTNKVKNPAGG